MSPPPPHIEHNTTHIVKPPTPCRTRQLRLGILYHTRSHPDPSASSCNTRVHRTLPRPPLSPRSLPTSHRNPARAATPSSPFPRPPCLTSLSSHLPRRLPSRPPPCAGSSVDCRRRHHTLLAPAFISTRASPAPSQRCLSFPRRRPSVRSHLVPSQDPCLHRPQSSSSVPYPALPLPVAKPCRLLPQRRRGRPPPGRTQLYSSVLAEPMGSPSAVLNSSRAPSSATGACDLGVVCRVSWRPRPRRHGVIPFHLFVYRGTFEPTCDW